MNGLSKDWSKEEDAILVGLWKKQVPRKEWPGLLPGRTMEGIKMRLSKLRRGVRADG